MNPVYKARICREDRWKRKLMRQQRRQQPVFDIGVLLPFPTSIEWQDVVQQAVCDPVLGDKVEKNVFVVFYSGERAKNIVKVIPIWRGICPQIISCDRTWMNKAKKQKKSQQIHEKEEESIDSD
ncbi:hypothetical protein LXL04_026239 [Taraxacum kok-saghyz]